MFIQYMLDKFVLCAKRLFAPRPSANRKRGRHYRVRRHVGFPVLSPLLDISAVDGLERKAKLCESRS